MNKKDLISKIGELDSKGLINLEKIKRNNTFEEIEIEKNKYKISYSSKTEIYGYDRRYKTETLVFKVEDIDNNIVCNIGKIIDLKSNGYKNCHIEGIKYREMELKEVVFKEWKVVE